MPKRSAGVHSRIRAEFATRGDEPRKGFTSNLSATGLFLAADSPYEIGALVRVKLLLAEPLELDTIVVHLRKGGTEASSAAQPGMGLRFLNPSLRLTELLEQPSAINTDEAADLTREALDAPVAAARVGDAPQDRAALAAPEIVDDSIETRPVMSDELGEPAESAEPVEPVEPAEPAESAEPEGREDPEATADPDAAGDPEDPEEREECEEREERKETSEMPEDSEAAPAVAQPAEVDPVSKSGSVPAADGEPTQENQLELKLAEAERDRRNLEAMLEDDEREKKMLRQLVAKLEEKRASPASEAAKTEDAAATARATAFATDLSALRSNLKAAEVESKRLRERVHTLESALAEQERVAHEQSVKPAREPARTGGRPMARIAFFLMGAVVIGSLAALVLVQILDSKQPKFETAVSARQDLKPVVVTPPVDREADQPSEDPMIELAETAASAGDPVDSGSDESSPDPAAAVELAVEAWARAWSEQRVEDYLDHYSVGFEPADGAALSEWRQQRQGRIERPSWIRVTVTRLTTRFPSPDTALAVFDQSYETATYKDLVRKRLRLVSESGGWKITQEQAEDL